MTCLDSYAVSKLKGQDSDYDCMFRSLASGGDEIPPPASESPFLLLSSVVNVQEEEEEGELQKHDRGQFSPLLGPPVGPREGRKQVYNDLVEEQELLLYIARTSP